MAPTHALSNPIVRIALVLTSIALVATPFAPSAAAGITRPFKATKTITLAPGIVYQLGKMRTTGGRRQSVRVGTINGMNPSASVRSMLSNDKVVRKERPSKIARRTSSPAARAMIATNGDRSVFGRVDALAAPHSMHVSNGELMVAQPCTRPTLGIDSSGRGRIDNVRVRTVMLIPGFDKPRIIHRVNTHRNDGLVVLYTKRFASSTQTAAGGIEVVLSLSEKVSPSGNQEVRVINVRRGGGNTTLRSGEAVLSVKGTGGKWVKQLKVGQRMTLRTNFVKKVDSACGGKVQIASGWSDVTEAMGGNYFTARNGKVKAPSAKTYRPGSQRHPRTNVGVTADGRVLMVTVDGRQSGYSVGVTLKEMGKLMVSLGAKAAFNLDGGGSTVMAKRNLTTGEFKVTNRPSDGRERVHSQALVAFETNP